MDDSTYYFSVVFSLALGFLVIRPSGIAFILTVLCRVFLSRYFKHFHLGRISLFPLSIDGLEIVTKPTKRRPEVSIKWESLKLLIDLHKSFDPLLRWLRLLRDPEQPTEQYRRRLVSVEFHQLEVSSPSIRFEDFIAPSPNKMPQPVPTVEGREVMPTTNLVSSMLAAKTLGQHLMMFFDVHFVAFSFDFHIPTTESVLQGSAERMHVTFPSPMNGWIESVGMRMQICEGQMEIVQGGVQAFHYVGHSACMCVDYHVPLGMMDVSMNLYGRQDDLAVAIKPFLEFHSRYQFVEDNVIEMKMARGLPTASKMSMCLEFEFMKIGVKDERCPNVLVLTMEKTRAELKTYKLSISNQPVYQGKVCTSADMGYTVAKPQPIGPVFMSPNQTKVMRIQTEKVEWVTDNRDGIAVVEGVRGTKTLQIFNETTFVDQDVMEVYVSSTRLERVSPIFLDWLLVMQVRTIFRYFSSFTFVLSVLLPVETISVSSSVDDLFVF